MPENEVSIIIAKTEEEALARLKDPNGPSVVVYGEIFGDRILPNLTDWYVDAHAACRNRTSAEIIFDHFAGEGKQFKYAWEERDLDKFPQVKLTRSSSQTHDSTAEVLDVLSKQINDLFNKPAGI